MEPHRCSQCVIAQMLRIKLHSLLNRLHTLPNYGAQFLVHFLSNLFHLIFVEPFTVAKKSMKFMYSLEIFDT